MKRISRVGVKALIGMLLMTVIICAVASFAVGMEYRQLATKKYTNLAYNYAGMAVNHIDGDKIAQYLNSPVEDDYYAQVRHALVNICSHSRLVHCNVFVPTEDGIVYIWSVDKTGDYRSVGYCRPYIQGEREAAVSELFNVPEQKLTRNQDSTNGDFASLHVPIYDSTGKTVALVGVDLPMDDITAEGVHALYVIVESIAAVIFLLTIPFFFILRKTLIRPITVLDASAKTLTQHLEEQTKLSLNIHTGDEIENLSHSFETMYREVQDYIRQLSVVTAEKQRIVAELDVAREIQASMLPTALARREEFTMAASMDPAREVGGDFYDFFMLDQRHLAFVVADVSGKGVPAALFMVIGKTLIKDRTVSGQDLGTVFTEVNQLLREANKKRMFITAFEGVLDLVTGELVFVNAGHERPFLCKAGGDFTVQKIRAGLMLGGMAGMRYQAGSILLEPGDILFQYTDGVPEACNAAGELFGMNRLNTTLNRTVNRDPVAILETVKADVDAFVGNEPQFDDITMFCLAFQRRMEEK